MAWKYRTREGPLSTVGVWVALTTQGSNSSPGTLLCPGSKIKKLLVSIGDNTPTAAAGGNVFLLRLSGACKEQVLCVGGEADPFTTDQAAHGANVYEYDVDIDVTPNAALYMEGCAASGTVVGTFEMAVTACFV